MTNSGEPTVKTQLTRVNRRASHNAQENELFSGLEGIHPRSKCEGTVCIVHNPTDHHMRSWTLHWRDDRGIFERICPDHGCGHPDPDQLDFWKRTGQEWQTVHGCCGDCLPVEERWSHED